MEFHLNACVSLISLATSVKQKLMTVRVIRMILVILAFVFK